MIILGIDPGMATTGYGLISFQNGKINCLESGWISTSKDESKEKRLISAFKQTRSLIKRQRPDVISIERLFFFINAKTAMNVAEFCGVIKLAAALEKIPIFEYAPKQIKNILTGNGRADKSEIKHHIRKLLKVRSPKMKKTYYDDVCDALAVAICHVKISQKQKKDLSK